MALPLAEVNVQSTIQIDNGRSLLFGVVSFLILLSFDVVCEKDTFGFLKFKFLRLHLHTFVCKELPMCRVLTRKLTPKHFLKNGLLVFIIALFFSPGYPALGSQQIERKKILVLFSFRPTLPVASQ